LEASLSQKASYLARALERWRELIQPVSSLPAGERLGYRDRVTLNMRWSDAAGWRFGLLRRDELIAIHDCPVHSERVNALVALLRPRLPPLAELPAAYLHVAGAQATLVIKAKAVAEGPLQALAGRMAGIGFEGFWLHYHPCAGRRLFARNGWKLLWGQPRSEDAHGLRYGPGSFMQPVPRLHVAALEQSALHLAPGRGSSVLDLYCGIGAGLRRWTGAGARVLGVELAGEAVSLAAENAPDAQLLRGTCAQRLPQVRQWWTGQDGPRLAYVNPPRSGLESPVLEALADELRPDRLAYLSCSAGTLSRDLARLEGAGLKVAAILPFDFFPLTHHVEALALLERA
jgi:tRNA/tmRNA/rRNA uracil-C5-methylase (TrmA/RlmC/RlmD family)